MKILSNLLVVLGVCLSALGASGFHRPITDPSASVESRAWFAFLGGMAALTLGGVLLRRTRQAASTQSAAGSGREALQQHLDVVRTAVVELDDAKESLSAEELRDKIGDLMSGPYFDLTANSDDLVTELGFSNYAKVWEGVATAERLLNRTWSQAADGYPEEGRTELPHARTAIEASALALSSI
jgi:hypothetical protein